MSERKTVYTKSEFTTYPELIEKNGPQLEDDLCWARHRQPSRGNRLRAEIDRFRAELARKDEALLKAVEWIEDTVGIASGEQQEFNDDTEALEHIDKRGRLVLKEIAALLPAPAAPKEPPCEGCGRQPDSTYDAKVHKCPAPAAIPASKEAE